MIKYYHQNVELRYNQDQQNLENALSDLQIIRLGSVGGSALTNTNVRSTVSGTVLQVPVKEGDQAIEANTFNPGTTIATVAHRGTGHQRGRRLSTPKRSSYSILLVRAEPEGLQSITGAAYQLLSLILKVRFQ